MNLWLVLVLCILAFLAGGVFVPVLLNKIPWRKQG